MHFRQIDDPARELYPAEGGGNDPSLQPEATPNPLDDVFGSDGAEQAPELGYGAAHPSDMNRLQTEHSTAGYREGVSVAKEKSIQAGFDEGFSLGASIGLRAGQLLGVIEGIVDALKSHNEEALRTAESLLAQAKEDLSTAKIFSPDYWAPDGNWVFHVKTKNTEEEIIFSDVAESHPLIQKWQKLVNEQMDVWKIDKAIVEQETGPRLETVPEPITRLEAASTLKKGLEW